MKKVPGKGVTATTNRLTNMNHYNQNFSAMSGYAYSYDKMNRLTQINHTAAVPAHAEWISNLETKRHFIID